jgi:hypothetical protein
MKKVLVSAAAFALVAGIASQAAAALPFPGSPGPQGAGTSNQAIAPRDGVSQIYIDGTSNLYCELGPASAGTGNNSTANFTNGAIGNQDGNGGETRNANSSDGVVFFNLQNANNDQVQAANQNVLYTGSICNTTFNVRVHSANGGLTFSGPGAAGFTSNVPYTVTVAFGAKTGSNTAANLQPSNGLDLIQADPPSVGTFTLGLSVASSSDLLLNGDYQDNVLVTMGPGV